MSPVLSQYRLSANTMRHYYRCYRNPIPIENPFHPLSRAKNGRQKLFYTRAPNSPFPNVINVSSITLVRFFFPFEELHTFFWERRQIVFLSSLEFSLLITIFSEIYGHTMYCHRLLAYSPYVSSCRKYLTQVERLGKVFELREGAESVAIVEPCFCDHDCRKSMVHCKLSLYFREVEGWRAT